MGEVGTKGDSGTKGSLGPSGPTGDTGADGESGEKGDAGVSGDKGVYNRIALKLSMFTITLACQVTMLDVSTCSAKDCSAKPKINIFRNRSLS